MKVYEVKEDLEFQRLATDERSRLSWLVRRLNVPIGDFQFPPFYVSTPKDRVGNFYNIGYEIFAFDDFSLEALANEASDAGELFKIEVEEIGELHVLNVLETCNSLDLEKTKWRDEDDGGKYVITEYAFIPENIDTKSGLFVIAENNYTRVFAVTDSAHQQGDFYAKYHEAGLTGLTYLLRWSDE